MRELSDEVKKQVLEIPSESWSILDDRIFGNGYNRIYRTTSLRDVCLSFRVDFYREEVKSSSLWDRFFYGEVKEIRESRVLELSGSFSECPVDCRARIEEDYNGDRSRLKSKDKSGDIWLEDLESAL